MAHDLLRFLNDYSDQKKEQYLQTIGQLQARRLSRVLDSAKKTPYYGGMIPGGTPPENALQTISAIRPTGKPEVVSSPGSFLAVPRNLLREIRTSGSSGIPIRAYADARTLIHRTAYRFLIESSYGRSPLELAVQVHDVLYPPTFMSQFGIFRKKFLSVFDGEAGNLETLRKSGSKVLSGYASSIAIMAKLNSESPAPIRLKHVFCYGEILGRETRELISGSFSCPVYQLYGSNEFGPIAHECPEEGKLHVNSGAFLVEIVDSEGRPAASGELLITSLVNHAMPLLRYRIGDVSRWGKCSCGRTWPVLESIEGRSDDFIALPGGGLRSAFSLFCLYGIPGLKEYQVVQEAEDYFVFRHVPTGDTLPASSKKEVVQKIRRAVLGADVHVDFEQVREVPRGRSGKRRSVVSKVAKSGDAHGP
jgi:phenylacetate-CoA ligase